MYVLLLKNYAKKTVVLTPQRPQGEITPLTPLTSELAKLEFYKIIRRILPHLFYQNTVVCEHTKK